MQAANYTLALYCDKENPEHEVGEFPHEFIDEFGSRCRAMARKAGWRLSRPTDEERVDFCPKCSGKKKKRLAPPDPTLATFTEVKKHYEQSSEPSPESESGAKEL
jgi:hypothetical protein